MNTDKVPCDCLNYCGDDPWLKEGKAEHCKQWKKRHSEEEEHKLFVGKVTSLIDSMIKDVDLHGLTTLNTEQVYTLFRYIVRK